MPSGFVSSIMNTFSLTEQQVDLVIISMITTIIQILIYAFIMKKTKLNLTMLGYFMIVLVYNVLYYKVFTS
jgi:hypothetical protein